MIRPYKSQDKNKLIELLRFNIPEFFEVSEEEDFIDYLDNHLESYFVIEKGEGIVGSGGINYFEDEGIARISWDIIHPEYHREGYGGKLIQHRIVEIKKNKNIHLIVVRTSQLAYQFYQKMGFTLKKIEKDFWAKGFDLYQMTLSIK